MVSVSFRKRKFLFDNHRHKYCTLRTSPQTMKVQHRCMKLHGSMYQHDYITIIKSLSPFAYRTSLTISSIWLPVLHDLHGYKRIVISNNSVPMIESRGCSINLYVVSWTSILLIVYTPLVHCYYNQVCTLPVCLPPGPPVGCQGSTHGH